MHALTKMFSRMDIGRFAGLQRRSYSVRADGVFVPDPADFKVYVLTLVKHRRIANRINYHTILVGQDENRLCIGEVGLQPREGVFRRTSQ